MFKAAFFSVFLLHFPQSEVGADDCGRKVRPLAAAGPGRQRRAQNTQRADGGGPEVVSTNLLGDGKEEEITIFKHHC